MRSNLPLGFHPSTVHIEFLFLLALILISSDLSKADDAVFNIPDKDWYVNFDPDLTWKDDVLYLPGEFDISRLPYHAPTQGWQGLFSKAESNPYGPIHVQSLPRTIEEFNWGGGGGSYRPYTSNEYYFAKTDTQVQNGSYVGVSWWWKLVAVPASFANKPVCLLKIRGARQRAEVFVNERLCGYSMLAETAFTCDVSQAIRPGQVNRIEIRITNPGGRFDWNDGCFVQWGKYAFQESHGFGGLDRGITLESHDHSYISDSWVLNGLDSHTIDAHAELTNTGANPVTGHVRFSVIDPRSGAILTTATVPATLPAAPAISLPHPLEPKPPTPASAQPALMVAPPPLPHVEVSSHFTVPTAELWTLDKPVLYTLKTEWIESSSTENDMATRTFGFRSFKAMGIGSQAGLYLNDVRIRLYTAISWGFWSMNGLFPTPELAAKEVLAAKECGLNCLNFHRNIGKEEVLDQQDQLGLLRYLEPGGGIQVLDASFKNETESPKGPINTAAVPDLFSPAKSTFAQRYEEKKILAMIRQFRSHPSVIVYNLHNEMEPNLHDPRLFTILREMHQADPSRIIVAKSGVKPICQVFFNPASATPDEPMYDDGTGYSGWRDEHTVGGAGTWTDDMYQDPQTFTHHIDDRREIVDWGEMLGSPTPDNHPLMLAQLYFKKKSSYDLDDHIALNDDYRHFLDRWKFRQAFPKDDAFYRDAGAKAYQFWGQVLETARLCESNDILTISGWESTAIEDHSGIVDNLRNCKGDPSLIHDKLAPLLPVIKPRGTIFKTGQTVTVDLYLLNETGQAVDGQIVANYTDPAGQSHPIATLPAPPYIANTFSYPVKLGITTDALTHPGTYQLQIAMNKEDGTELAHNSESINVYSTDAPSATPCKIGYLGTSPSIQNELRQWSNLSMESWQPGHSYDVLVAPTEPSGQVFRTDVGLKIAGTDDEVLYRTSIQGRPENLQFNIDDLPNGSATVTLYFCEPKFSEPGKRTFDVSIDDQVVLKDFDIFAAAKSANTAVVKSFPVTIKNGSLTIRPSRVVDHGVSENTRSEALFNGIKVEAAGKTWAITCGGETYTDAHGLTWHPYKPRGSLSDEFLKQVREGTPLLILADNPGAGDTTATRLAEVGAIQYKGLVPSTRAPWMGNWVFVRDHPSFSGLPVNEVMKGDYQIPASRCYGLNIDGPDVDVIVGYGRDHDRNVGAATFTCKLGHGTILFQGLSGMNPVMFDHWLIQTIQWMQGQKGD